MRILKIFFTLILVLVLALVTLVFVLPGEKIAKLAADQVKSQTGRELTFDGEVNFSVFPTLGIATGPVQLSNADWSDAGPMFRAQGAKIGVDLMGLMGGDIQVKDIILTAPDILLEKNADGHANWDLFGADGASEANASADASPPTDESGTSFTLDHVKVTDARVRYVDHGGESYEIKNLDADLEWGAQEATLSLTVTPVDQEVEVDLTVGNLDALIAGDITSVTTQIKGAGNRISFDGRASIVPEAAGAVDANLPNAGGLMAALGLGGADIPATVFKGDITLTKEQLFSLRNGDVSVFGNDLRAEADVQLAGKPFVTANIQAGALDMSPFLGGDETSTGSDGPVEAGSGWPTDIIDASALGLFDGSIAISASSLDTGSLKFGASRLKIDIDRARAVASLQELHGYDGIVSGQFVVNNRSGLSVGGKMQLASLSLKGLLTDLAGIDRFTGQADAQLAFLGVGGSVDAIMKSLKGDGTLNVGQGTISGINLDKLFRGTPSGGTTVFDSMAASWTIEGGVMRNDDLRMELPSILAKGNGVIGLGAQTVDYTFTPQIRNDTETGIAVPVRVKGPWGAPKIWPDLEAVVNQNLAEEKKALEEKAKKAVAEKLGVTAEEGQSVKEAVEQELEKKLEDEVGNALKKLLGGG